MPSYFVHIPGTEAPTAEVEASNTKHARTAYLDYLSRNNLIGWQDRQAVRERVHVGKMEPGSLRTEIQLDYTAYTAPEQEIEVPPELGQVPVEEEYEETPELPYEPEPQPQAQDPYAGSPIVELSRRRRAL